MSRHATRNWTAALTGAAITFGLAVARRRRMISFAGAAVAISGGSRGLGLVLARTLAREGARLALLARDVEELERARAELEERGATVIAIPCDVRDRRQAEWAIAQVADAFGGLDVLINNAGIIQVGPQEHTTPADYEDALATHFWGPLHLTFAALPHLRRSRRARLVNISSIGGKIAVPHLLPYSASKFALAGFSEGLRAELARDGVLVTTVCPGLMRTGSTYQARFKGQHRAEFAWFHLASSIPGLTIAAERAARQIVEAARRGRAELVITLPARVAVLARAAFPGAVAAATALANRLLPAPVDGHAPAARTGWQSTSRVAPSIVTRLADQATRANNELPV